MKPNWAEENLQTIRTLMERSAIYRRALAPIMIFVGVVGIIGGIVGWKLTTITSSGAGFVFLWSVIAAVALVGTFLLVRRQAMKDSEPLWSSPTKRVTQALIPSFAVGAFVAGAAVYEQSDLRSVAFLIPVWCWAFGCAMTSAGFFMPRGVKIFGWLFIVVGFCLTIGLIAELDFERWVFSAPHLCMGGIFGGLHLAYGIYLYFTERKNPVA